MQQVTQLFSSSSTLVFYYFKAGLLRNKVPFSAHVPEEKVKALRMEHLYLGILVLNLSKKSYNIITAAFLFLGAGIFLSSLIFLLEKSWKWMS